ncbi:MAG: DUF917 family protein [Anaerolineae bacterium]|nr:DUF917 family protein [Anaerolineae bacterium]
MPRRRLSSMQDCEDLIRGCLVMGTGGGGSAEWGREVFTAAFDEGLEIEWVDVDDIPDDAWTVTPYGMGSIAPASPETRVEIDHLGLVDTLGRKAIDVAVREMEEYAQVKIGAIVPVELGAGNTPAPLVTGARLAIPVVDGDYAGRAIPEEMQGTPYLYDKKGWPFTSVDRWGNVCIVKEACSLHMMERIGKMLSVAAYEGCSMAAYLLPGREMKQIVVRDTLTTSLELGRTIRQARERDEDPVLASLGFTGGWLLFEGQVVKKEWEDREGYMFGTIYIEGRGEFSGHTFKIWFKNENHVSWLDDEPFVTSPDLVAVVERESGEGITNTLLDAGRDVAVIGMKGLEAFRSEKGLAGAGPRYFGFDIDYVPIEERTKKG